MSNRLILWDFDGTLADTLRLAVDAYNQIAQSHGFKLIEDPEAIRDTPLRQFLKSHRVPAWRMPQLFTKGLKLTSAAVGTVSLFPGIRDSLATLQQAGFRHCIVSSNSVANIDRCLEFNDAASLFEEVCGTSKLAGKERRIRKALKQRSFTPDQCLYIGDEIRDIDAAQAAGLDIGCVSWGLNSADALRNHSPVFLAQSTDQLPDLIQQHFGFRAAGCSSAG